MSFYTYITKLYWSPPKQSANVLPAFIKMQHERTTLIRVFKGCYSDLKNWYFLSQCQKALSVVSVPISSAIKNQVASEKQLILIATLATSVMGRKRAGLLQSLGALQCDLNWPGAKNSATLEWKGLHHPNCADSCPRTHCLPVRSKLVNFLQGQNVIFFNTFFFFPFLFSLISVQLGWF